MGLDIILYKIINVHECKTKRVEKEKTIFTFDNHVFTKRPDDTILKYYTPVTYKKYICDCNNSFNSRFAQEEDDIIIYRPKIGWMSWSDSVHFGELYDVVESYSFRFGSYSSFPPDDMFEEMVGWGGGTYRGSKVQTLFENIRYEEYEKQSLILYQHLLSLIDDFDTFIIEHN